MELFSVKKERLSVIELFLYNKNHLLCFRHTGQRDYKCGVCEFYGYTFTDIRKHIERKHTDNKTFICDKCGTLFMNEGAYRVCIDIILHSFCMNVYV